MTAVGLIPARYAASRFPGKPLARIAGRSMIQRVYEGARAAKSLRTVIVATDDARIADCQCRSWVRADRADLDGVLAATVDAWLLGPEWPFATVRWPGGARGGGR